MKTKKKMPFSTPPMAQGRGRFGKGRQPMLDMTGAPLNQFAPPPGRTRKKVKK